jgi:hypothetical protein
MRKRPTPIPNVSKSKLGATTKRAKKIRTKSEFPIVRLAPEMRFPLRMLGDFAWDAETIRSARTEQLRGYFWSPAKLAQSMNSDAGLFTARLNRLAPMRGLPIELRAADESARAQRQRDEGEALFGHDGIACQRDQMVTLHKHLIDHGVAFGFLVWTPRPDGSRVDVELRVWPIEFVRWLPQARAFFTLTKQGQLMKIEHGDGRWVVFQQERLDPWSTGCIIPGCMIWADRAFAIRDRSNASRSHGQAKMIGEMPANMAIQMSDGKGGTTLTPEALMMLQLLQEMHVGDLPIGLRPAGAKTDLVVNTSQSWQIWENIVKTNDADSSRIYLGQDGTTQDAGGNYVKSQRLFNVRNDLVEADLGVFRECLKSGMIDVWSAINFGDSRFAPTRVWQFPDSDEDARRTSIGERTALFFRDVNSLVAQGFVVDQNVVNKIATAYGVGPFSIGPQGLKTIDAPEAAPPSTGAPAPLRAVPAKA